MRSAGDGRFTVVENRRVEPNVTYDATKAVGVCLAEIDRLGVRQLSAGQDDVRSV